MMMQERQGLPKHGASQSHPPLTERDRAVIETFRAVRFAETSQLAALFVPALFPTEEKLRRRLRTLARLRYVDRPARRIAPERMDEFKLVDEKRPRGRPEDIWALAQKGADALKLSGDWNKNNARLRPGSFAHPLMITTVFATLKLATDRKLATVEDWMGEGQWRGRINVDGETLPLVPDAVFLLSDAAGQHQELLFLETDNSTEPLKRSTLAQSSFFKKCIAFWTYWAEELRPKKESVILLTIAKTPERAEALRRTAAQVDAEGRGLNLFWFCSESDWKVTAPTDFLHKPIWTTARGERRALFEAQQPPEQAAQA